jgi:ABC-type nickel/cobalt efflux system permease component RcnA
MTMEKEKPDLLGRIPYVVVTTTITMVGVLLWPATVGQWHFALITVPLFFVLALWVNWRVLRKHRLPFWAKCDDMRRATRWPS